MAKTNLRLVTPDSEIQTVTLRRRSALTSSGYPISPKTLATKASRGGGHVFGILAPCSLPLGRRARLG